MKKVRVLYIEDDEIQRKKLSNGLRSKEYSVSVAASGETGLRVFNTKTFDVILCNFKPQGMDGIRILENIRLEDPNIPFIILSTHGTATQAVEAIRKGANHFVLKPTGSDQIAITIQQIIEKSNIEKKKQESQAALQRLQKMSRILSIP